MPFSVIVPGLPTPPSSVGTGQSGSNPTTKTAQPQLEYTRFARNGLPPSAHLANQMMDAANSLAMNRGKVPFCTFNRLHNTASSQAASLVRHRFAWHSGPLTHAIMVWIVMYPPSSGLDEDGYATFTVYSDASEATSAASETFHYGANPTGSTAGFGWNHIRVISKMIDGITPDTDYTAKITQENYGRVCSVLVIELPSMTEHYDGYMNSNIAAGTLVLDTHREKVATLARNIWRRGGAHVFNFDCDNHGSPKTTSSSTAANVLDTSLTSVAASNPGYTLDMTGKARESETSGVPCVMKAFGEWSEFLATDPGGTVQLLDSSGAVIAEIEDGWAHGADPTWVSTTFNLPAASDRYELFFKSNSSGLAGTFTLYSVSVYEHHS